MADRVLVIAKVLIFSLAFAISILASKNEEISSSSAPESSNEGSGSTSFSVSRSKIEPAPVIKNNNPNFGRSACDVFTRDFATSKNEEGSSSSAPGSSNEGSGSTSASVSRNRIAPAPVINDNNTNCGRSALEVFTRDFANHKHLYAKLIQKDRSEKKQICKAVAALYARSEDIVLSTYMQFGKCRRTVALGNDRINMELIRCALWKISGEKFCILYLKRRPSTDSQQFYLFQPIENQDTTAQGKKHYYVHGIFDMAKEKAFCIRIPDDFQFD